MPRQPRRINLGRSDRKAVIALVVLASLAVATTFYMGLRTDTATMPADTLATAARHTPSTSGTTAPENRRYYKVEERKVELFDFDPNTADSTALLRLGLQPWQVRGIYKYRARGGVFSRPSDFARLYGLTMGQYRRLEPHIRIARAYRLASETIKPDRPEASPQATPTVTPRPHSNKIGDNERVTLNTADTTELMRVPGIGRYYARRIVEYGHRLGGYVSVAQLGEIRDLPPNVARFFVVSAPSPQTINVNKLSVSQLARHPYMGYARAKAICAYRRLHGPLTSLGQLGACSEFSADDISRLTPYVEY